MIDFKTILTTAAAGALAGMATDVMSNAANVVTDKVTGLFKKDPAKAEAERIDAIEATIAKLLLEKEPMRKEWGVEREALEKVYREFVPELVDIGLTNGALVRTTVVTMKMSETVKAIFDAKMDEKYAEAAADFDAVRETSANMFRGWIQTRVESMAHCRMGWEISDFQRNMIKSDIKQIVDDLAERRTIDGRLCSELTGYFLTEVQKMDSPDNPEFRAYALKLLGY